MRERDNQRRKVYSAELCIRDKRSEKYGKYLQVGGSIQSSQVYVNKLLESAWLSRRWNVQNLDVIPGGGARGGRYEIRLAKWARCEAVILHELAHALLQRTVPSAAPHGPEFAAIFHYLVKQVFGKEVADELKAGFKRYKVRIRRNVIPKPQLQSRGAIKREKRKQSYEPLGAYEMSKLKEWLEQAIKAQEFGPVGSTARNDARKVLRHLSK